jgi:hypothetical protein
MPQKNKLAEDAGVSPGAVEFVLGRSITITSLDFNKYLFDLQVSRVQIFPHYFENVVQAE